MIILLYIINIVMKFVLFSFTQDNVLKKETDREHVYIL